MHSGTDFNLHIPANALLFAVIAGLPGLGRRILVLPFAQFFRLREKREI